MLHWLFKKGYQSQAGTPKTQAEAILFYLQGNLIGTIDQKANESDANFKNRQQKHQTKALRKLLHYLIKCDDGTLEKENSIVGINNVGGSEKNNDNIEDILNGARQGLSENNLKTENEINTLSEHMRKISGYENQNKANQAKTDKHIQNSADNIRQRDKNVIDGQDYQARLASLYSLITHVMKHNIEIHHGVRLRLGRYIRHDREGQKIMRGLGLSDYINSSNHTGADTSNKPTATARIKVSDELAPLYEEMEKYHKANKSHSDDAVTLALEKFKPRKAWRWHRFGKFLAVFVALAVLLTLTPFMAQFLMSLGAGAAIAYPIAVLFSGIGAWVNFKLFQNMVPDTLLDFFSFGPLFTWTEKSYGIGPFKFKFPLLFHSGHPKKYWFEEEDIDGKKTHEVRTYSKGQSWAAVGLIAMVFITSGVAAIFTFIGVSGILAALIGSGPGIIPVALVFAAVLFSVYGVLYLKSYTKLIQGGSITKTIRLNLGKLIKKLNDQAKATQKRLGTYEEELTTGLSKRQQLAAKTIFWTIFTFTFLLVNAGAVLAGYTAVVGSFFAATPIIGYVICMGVNTIGTMGFAATSSAFFAEKVSKFVFYTLYTLRITRAPSLISVPLTVLLTLVMALSSPATFILYIIGQIITAYVKAVASNISGFMQSTGISSLPWLVKGPAGLLLAPILAATSPAWMILLPIAAWGINRIMRLLSRNPEQSTKVVLANLEPQAQPKLESSEPTAAKEKNEAHDNQNPSNKNTLAESAEPQEDDKKSSFSWSQFALIFINALPNALQYMGGINLMVKSWLSGAGQIAQYVFTAVASVPGYLMSLTALFNTPYGGKRDDYARAQEKFSDYQSTIAEQTSWDVENDAQEEQEEQEEVAPKLKADMSVLAESEKTNKTTQTGNEHPISASKQSLFDSKSYYLKVTADISKSSDADNANELSNLSTSSKE